MIGAASAVVAFAHVARADDVVLTDTGYEHPVTIWRDPAIYSGVGVGVHLGGGVFGFTDPTMRNLTSPVGGTWNFRAAFGTHVPIGAEVGYVGNTTQIVGQLSNNQATMLGTELDGTLRVNVFPRSRFCPYIFGGLGWQHYQLNDRTFELSDTGVASSDDLLVIPVGAGLSFRHRGFVTDLRGTFRAAENENMVLSTTRDSEGETPLFAKMHTWDASLNVGYEF